MQIASRERHDVAVRIAAGQAGVVSRQQLLTAGWSHDMIRHQLAARRWRSIERGAYLTYTGEPTVHSWWWVAHLLAGQRSSLFGWSALQAWGVRPPSLPVLIGVPWRSGFHAEHEQIRVIRSRLTRPARIPTSSPPAAELTYATLDATQSLRRGSDVAALVTEVCRSTAATPGKFTYAMTTYKRLKHRKLLLEVVEAAAEGAESVLEVDADALVFKPHGLPAGRRQVPSENAGVWSRRDLVLEDYKFIVEFDGRLGHADPNSRLRDFRRDNAALAAGYITHRYGWQDVHETPCQVAAQIAQTLRTRGWTAPFTRCGPACVTFE